MTRPANTSRAPLADACVTEWRTVTGDITAEANIAPLADACVTEWRYATQDILVERKGATR